MSVACSATVLCNRVLSSFLFVFFSKKYFSILLLCGDVFQVSVEKVITILALTVLKNVSCFKYFHMHFYSMHGIFIFMFSSKKKKKKGYH